MNLKRAWLSLVLATVCFCMRASAEMPRQFYFEDYYNGTNGLPYTGYIDLQLQLYSTVSNGICLYEDSNTVEVVDGFYATLIGDNPVSGSLTNALAGGQTFVQVIVNGTPLSPREPLVPVPYALNAAGVASNTITSSMISSAAIQSSHLASGAITANKLAGDVDDRYVNASGDAMGGELNMDENSIRNVAFIDWHGNGIDIEAHASSSNSVWGNWNADLLDGKDSGEFISRKGDSRMDGTLTMQGNMRVIAPFASMELAAQIPATPDGGNRPQCLYVQGNYAYGANLSRLSIYDVSDPANPSNISVVSLIGDPGGRDLQVDGNYAYANGMGPGGLGFGFVIVNVADPLAPSVVRYTSPIGNFDPKGNLMFTTLSNQLVIFNIANQMNWTEISRTSVPGAGYILVENGIAYISTSNSVRLFNVSNPAAPVQVGSVNVNNPGKLTLDGTRLYGLSASQLKIVDVTVPSAPTVLLPLLSIGGYYEWMAVEDGYAYVAGDSVRVYDVKDSASPVLMWSSNLTGVVNIGGIFKKDEYLLTFSYFNNKFNSLRIMGQAGRGVVTAEAFVGDGAGLKNISASAVEDGSGSGLDADLLDGLDSTDFALNPHEHDDEYVNVSGDTMTGDFSLAGSLILLPTQESVLSPGFQSDGDVTIHWMTESGTYFKYGEIAGGGDRFHFGSDGSFQAWGDIYSRGGASIDGGLSVAGDSSISGNLSVGDRISINAADGLVEAASMKIGSVVLGGTSNALVVPNLADSASGAVRIGVDEGTLYGDWELEGRGSVKYEPIIGTNQYALWVRNFGATPNDARGLLVTTPEYNNGAGIIFHAASKAGQSMASRFIVGTDGNVGVGVNDPQNKLHVAGDARVSGNLLMMDGQNILSPNFNPGSWGSGYNAWGPNAYLKYGFVRELLVAQNSDFQGKVKIGTSSDYAILNVGAPTNLVTPTYAARFESVLGADSDKARGLLVNFPNTTNANSILFHAMSGAGPYTNSRFVVKADGKVGIGTAYPEATLHVHGDARFDQVVWIQPAGDLSMGSYTNGAPQ